NVLGAQGLATELTDAVLRLVAGHHGSVSSEHGIGRAKVPWLGLSRSPAEIDVMRRIKDALDPAGLLGPGVLRPGSPQLPGSCGVSEGLRPQLPGSCDDHGR